MSKKRVHFDEKLEVEEVQPAVDATQPASVASSGKPWEAQLIPCGIVWSFVFVMLHWQ